VSSRGGPPRMYRKGEDGPLLMLHATPRDSGTTELHLRVDFTAPGWSGYPPGRHGRPEAMELLPALYPPDGVGMEGGGGGGSDASWSSHATATTTMPVAELESFFAAQLARDGWTRLAGDSGDVTAWSSWKVGAKGDWRAVLIVLASPEGDERWLTVHMQRRSDHCGGWASAVSTLRRR
jgi:hypothetical protein